MKLLDALHKLKNENICVQPFKILFRETDISLMNKGKTGQLLELLLGLKNSNTLLDFEDGELKTNKAKINGLPDETMFITQISKHADDLLGGLAFEESWLFQKISRLIYLPVVKIGEPKEWYFKTPIYFDIQKEESIYKTLESDYYSIIEQMKSHIKTDGKLHTSSGKYIQIRTKDSKPYHPIFWKTNNCYISNKNFAFYFKKDFMKDLLKKSLEYPDIN